jgi:hypothetical protein
LIASESNEVYRKQLYRSKGVADTVRYDSGRHDLQSASNSLQPRIHSISAAVFSENPEKKVQFYFRNFDLPNFKRTAYRFSLSATYSFLGLEFSIGACG